LQEPWFSHYHVAGPTQGFSCSWPAMWAAGMPSRYTFEMLDKGMCLIYSPFHLWLLLSLLYPPALTLVLSPHSGSGY
jgi:hypothetical protein